MIERLYKLGSQHTLLRASVLGALGGGVLWGVLSGSLFDALAGVVFGVFIAPFVEWVQARRERRGAAARARVPQPPPIEPTAEEVSALDEYRTSPDLRLRRWVFFILPPVGGLLSFLAANFLFDANLWMWPAAFWGVLLGMFLAVRWFSADAYLKSKNPSGRPQY